MTSQQAALHTARGMMDAGMSAVDANVEVVRMMGFKVGGRLPRDIRRGLMAAVAAGRLGRLPADGLEPEMFHHPNCRGPAMEERRRIARSAVGALGTVLGRDAAELKGE